MNLSLLLQGSGLERPPVKAKGHPPVVKAKTAAPAKHAAKAKAGPMIAKALGVPAMAVKAVAEIKAKPPPPMPKLRFPCLASVLVDNDESTGAGPAYRVRGGARLYKPRFKHPVKMQTLSKPPLVKPPSELAKTIPPRIWNNTVLT